jgi:hypothetical protein
MTEEFMGKWLTELLDSRPGALMKKRAMQAVGAFKGHLTEKMKTLNF